MAEQYPMHAKLQQMNADLNEFYRTTPAFYEIEDSWDGFEWVAPNDADRNVVAYLRRDGQGNTYLVAVNFSGVATADYRLGVPKGKYKLVFNTDDGKYGGSGTMRKRIFSTERKPSHGKEYSIRIEIPALSCLYLEKIL